MLNLTLKAENIIYSQKHYPSYGSKIATNYQYKSSLQKIKTTPTNNQQTTNDIMKNQSKKALVSWFLRYILLNWDDYLYFQTLSKNGALGCQFLKPQTELFLIS